MKSGVLLAVLLASSPALAEPNDLALAPTLSDGAVLQRGQPIEISGLAGAGERVTVVLAGVERTVVAARDGHWQASFPAMPATIDLGLAARTSTQTIELRDIAIGDVFLCSGQSNMQFTMTETAMPPHERKQPIDSSISLFQAPRDVARVEQAAFRTPVRWSRADAGSGSFSGVCMIAGRELAKREKVPIGLIEASLGATPIESWLPRDGLAVIGGMERPVAILDAFKQDPVKAEATYGGELDALWREQPAVPGNPGRGRIGYANLFNAMIAPLGHIKLAGAIWYQGENNARNGDTRAAYRAKLAALLTSWRQRFGQQLPFAIVQIAPFGPLSAAAEESSSAEVREAERQVALADPLAALVITSDVGERLDIHPPLKKPVGQRAAAALENLIHPEAAVANGPQPLGATIAGKTVRVRIDAGTQPLMAASWGRPGPFMLCAASGPDKCRFADAQIDGGDIAISVPDGFAPTTVRYCWGAAPICNVFNRAEQPLGPFELDIAAGR